MGKIIIFCLLAATAVGSLANFNGDCIVNYLDFDYLAADWLQSDPNIVTPAVDLDDDGVVDVNDLILFSDDWLVYESGYSAPTTSNEKIQGSADGQGYYEFIKTGGTVFITKLPDPNWIEIYDPNNADPDYDNPVYTTAGFIKVETVPYQLLDTNGRVLIKSDPNCMDEYTMMFYADNDLTDDFCGKSNISTVTLHCTNTPVAYDQSNSIVTHQVYEFALFGADDGYPQALVYDVNSLDPNSIMADPFVGTPILTESLLPWELRFSGNKVLYITDEVGSKSFNFYCSDSVNLSNVGTVNLTVTANPKDSLYLIGEPNSVITIPDCNELDFNGNGFAVSFWVNNYLRKPYLELMKKRGSAQGYEISVKAGKIQFDLYNSAGNSVISKRADIQISDGNWYAVEIACLAYDTDPNYSYINFMVYDENTQGYGYDGSELFDPNNYSNDESLQIKSSLGIDHIRFWDDAGTLISTGIYHCGRTCYTEQPLGLLNASDVRYKIDEGSGGVIVDDKGVCGNGVFDPNYVQWLPPYEIFRSKVKYWNR